MTHDEEPNSDESMTSISSSGRPSNLSARTTSLIAWVTDPPSSAAPANSVKQAMITACRSVMDRAETEVANAFATSLAPIPYESQKAIINPRTRIHV